MSSPSFVVVLQRRRRRQQQFSSPSSMVLLQKKVTATNVAFFGGFIAEKVMVAMSSPLFMVVREKWMTTGCRHLFFFSMVFLV
jgi:hypothetical protein